MNVDAKILNKILACQDGFIPEVQALFNICKLINLVYHKTKEKNYMIISIDKEKALTKFNIHSLYKKKNSHHNDESEYLNIIKAMYVKATINITLNSESISSKFRN